MKYISKNIVLAAAASLIAVSAPQPANATHEIGHAIAGGIIGGIIGGAIVNNQRRYQQPVYQQPVYQQPVYRQPVYVQPRCYKTRVWVPDGYGGQVQVVQTVCE